MNRQGEGRQASALEVGARGLDRLGVAIIATLVVGSIIGVVTAGKLGVGGVRAILLSAAVTVVVFLGWFVPWVMVMYRKRSEEDSGASIDQDATARQEK